MTDNELFNHFKSNAAIFDEMPGDALWTKIKGKLDNGNSTVKPFTILFIAALCIVAFIVTYYFFEPESKTTETPSAPADKELHDIPVTKPAITLAQPVSNNSQIKQGETVNVVPLSVISRETLTPITPDSIKKIRVRTAKTSTAATQPAKLFFKTIDKNNIPESLTFEVKKQETPGNIIVSTKQKITAAEYQKLIEDMLKENETSVGTLLIIKASGHKSFRKVIELDTEKEIVKTADVDSIIINVKVEPLKQPLQLEKIQVNSSYINPEHVSFSRITTTPNDSLSKGNNKLKE